MIIHRVAMRLLDGAGIHCIGPLARIPEGHLAVVHAAQQHVGVLGIVVDRAQLRGRLELLVGRDRVAHVPDVRARIHALGLALELHDGVRHGDLARAIGVPADVLRRALNGAGVPEDGHGLRIRLLARVVHHVAAEVLLVDIHGIVLADVCLHTRAKLADRRHVVLVLFDLLAEAHGLLNLGVVNVARPASLLVYHALVLECCG